MWRFISNFPRFNLNPSAGLERVPPFGMDTYSLQKVRQPQTGNVGYLLKESISLQTPFIRLHVQGIYDFLTGVTTAGFGTVFSSRGSLISQGISRHDLSALP
jgi:hypothetical protein